MILPFSTQINGAPTLFPEKILKGLYEHKIINSEEINDCMELRVLVRKGVFYNIIFDKTQIYKPKIHTIRQDKNDRWKPGVMLDFFINARQKNMFRFAPRIPVISVQKVFMTYLPHLGNGFEVSIDGKYLYKKEIEQLAINDGFDNVEDFENYFISQMKDDEFSGKIIHWTNLKY